MIKKKKLVLVISWAVFLLFSLSFSSSPAQSESELPAISMDFQDADLRDVLKVFSQQAGLNFIAGENVKERKVTLYLDKVSVQDALNTIISANNLTYEQEKDSRIFVVKEWGKPEIETVTRIFPLQYARVRGYEFAEGDEEEEEEKTNIQEVIENIVSEYGRVIGDSRSNSLIVTDVPSQFPKIEKTINELDVRLSQVMIEAEIIEASLETIDKLGIEWGSADAGQLFQGAGSARTTKWPFMDKGEGVGTAGVVDGLYMGYLSAIPLGGTLAMLAKDTDSRILARPKILTLNNETAEIAITADTAIASITETSSAEGIATQSITAERVETGITLKVTPHINRKGEITMAIEPSVINTKQSAYFANFVDPYTRSVRTTVTIRNGETLIIGGLINSEDSKIARKVPFLGDIPLLGNIFRKKDDNSSDKELIIFITPHLVKEQTKTAGLAQDELYELSWEYETQDLRKEEAMERALDRFEE